MADQSQQLEREIASARQRVLELVSGLGEDQLAKPTSNEGWSVHDTLAHLSSIEARLQAMWQHALDGRQWPADDADVHAYNATAVAERRSWSGEALVTELRESGRQTLAFLDRLAPGDLARTWTHPTRGEVSLESLIEIVPRHLRAHAEELRAALGV